MPRLSILSLGLLVVAVATGSAVASSATASRAVTVRCTETLKGNDITNGGVSGKGHCTLRGAINDKGKATDYRKKVANAVLIRRVVVGRKGTIAFLIRINLGTGTEPWSVKSGTKVYRGLHGKGRQVVDDFMSTPAKFVMKGTVGK